MLEILGHLFGYHLSVFHYVKEFQGLQGVLVSPHLRLKDTFGDPCLSLINYLGQSPMVEL